MPSNNIERLVIGILMLASDSIWLKLKISSLNSKYFYTKLYKDLFEDIKNLNSAHLSTDVVTISEQYPNRYDEIELLEIQNSVATIELIDSYIIQLRDIWGKKEIDRILLDSRIKFNKSIKVEEDCSEHINNIKTVQTEIKRIRNYSQLELRENTKKEILTQPDKNMLVPYMLPEYTDLVNIFRGQVFVLASESGLGKTAFSLSCMQYQYLNGINTAYFCCESTAQEILIRIACQKSTNSFSNVVKGFPYGNKTAFIDSLDHFKIYPERLQIYGRDNYNHTIENIEYILWEISKHTRIDMIYIDYFQTLKKETSKRGFKKQYEVYEEIIDSICNLAVKYNCAITLLSQLNRERSDDALPGLMNLKGCSALENACHAISFLHQKKQYKNDSDLRIKPTLIYSRKTRLIAPYNLTFSYDSYCGMFHKTIENVPFPWKKYPKKGD